MSKRNQRISVANLRPGMYVVKLDRPWLSTPFDPQGFPISSPAQIKILAKYCKSVHVDAGRAAGGGRTVSRVKQKIALTRAKAPARRPVRARKRSGATAR